MEGSRPRKSQEEGIKIPTKISNGEGGEKDSRAQIGEQNQRWNKTRREEASGKKMAKKIYKKSWESKIEKGERGRWRSMESVLSMPSWSIYQ